MKKIAVGIFAHVDAGKTTLSEAMLYTGGMLRTMGRVDNKDTFLDTNELERNRGITIFSKQARFVMPESEFVLMDTPGHVDFSAEMERTLQVIDYAVLLISAADGIQGHTATLWSLFARYNIPVFIFVNKMDQPGSDKEMIMSLLKKKFSDSCLDFSDMTLQEFLEELALVDEYFMDKALGNEELDKNGKEDTDKIAKLIADRKIFPCFFGSALKLDGVDVFLEALNTYTAENVYGDEFGGRIYKISRDSAGNRLAYMKITGGSLKVKDIIRYKTAEGEDIEEKINQIRLYSGDRFKTVNEAEAGEICCVTGLSKIVSGQGIGSDADKVIPVLEPVLTYAVILPEDVNPQVFLPKLREIEDEEPQLHVVWNEELKEINVRIMGEVQIEILSALIFERFGIQVSFGAGSILYRETIANTVEGVGHFEPLRHYAEVHLVLEPLELGSGLVFESRCSEDELDKNWQRLILTHLEEKEHKGVLTGAPVTDMKISLAAGRSHKKHTEGGDFRQATYRAVRQGLMEAESILLEPYYNFRLEVPSGYIGRAMTDMERKGAVFEAPGTEGEVSVLEGCVPVAAMEGYAKELVSYSKGQGKLFCTSGGYRPSHNSEDIVDEKAYNPEADLENTPDSVFCAHGAGFVVKWDQVKDYMHVESVLSGNKKTDMQVMTYPVRKNEKEEIWLGVEEVDAIIAGTSFANRHEDGKRRGQVVRRTKAESAPVTRVYKKPVKRKEYLLVDGYNVIFAWDNLNELAKVNVDGARGSLMDTLCNYQAIKGINLIVVFDAYRVKGHQTEVSDYKNIHVVFTKEAETADQYIEKFAHTHGEKYDITVVTSDGLEQIIIRGEGCKLISSREFEKIIKEEEKVFNERYQVK